MRRMIQFSVLLITVFVMLIISCNMPSDPFKKPSNSKARLFLEENEQTIDFGSEVKIGVSIFLAEHIEALHINTRNNGLDSIHPYSSNAVDDTLYFYHKFNVEGKDTIFVTGILKDKKYMNKTDTLPVFILPAPDSIRFDSIPQSLFTVTENHDTLQFIASLRSEKPLSFSVKSQPALDTNQLKIAQFKDTVRVFLTTDSTGEYAVTLYAQRDTLIDSAVVNVTAYEPLVFESAVLSDIIPFGKNDTLVFTVPTEREDTLTCKLLNEDDFAENELSFIKENSDSLAIVFTPDSGGEYEFLLLLDNGKIKDTLKYTVTVDDNPSVGVFIENHKDTVPFGTPVNIGVSVFLPQLIEELHISTSTNSLDSALELSATDDTVYVSHEFCTEGDVKIYVTAKPVNSDYEEKIDSLTINVLPAPEEISFDSIPGKLHTVTGLTDTLLFLAKSSKGNSLEFSVKSDPALNTDHLEVVKSNDTARVIVSTDKAGKYGITLYAQRDTVKDSAEVGVISYEPLVFKTAVVPDIIALGCTDSLVFIVQTEREDTLTCKLLNKDDFSETEFSVLTESADSLVIAFTPEIEGQREFAMFITNGHIKDTLNYDVFVSEKIPVWKITEKTIDAVEGEEISVDLRDFINESFPGDFSLDSDLGEIKDTVWKWTPPWGSDTVKTAIISAVCGSDVYKLKLIISVAEGDTTGPAITLMHSSMNDTVIGSSQINVEAVVKDTGAGVSSVQISYGSNSANMGLIEDSIYIYPVKELKNGEKTEIKIVAQDGSMRKNTTEHVFYITYDSTIGDNEAPVISQESGPENNSRITDGQIQLSFSVTDDSDIDSVYWTLDGTIKGILAKDDSIYSLTGTLGEYGSNEIEIFAVDKSIHRNRSSQKLVFDYNTEITAIDIISPKDDASGIDTSGVTFEWSGGNDEDGDTVFVELVYNVSNIKLTKKITGINCSTLVLTDRLNLYTEYNWYIIAYSKAYPDTVKSSIYSFKTKAVPPEIKDLSDRNINVDIGEKIVLRVSATGTPEPSYKWKMNGTVMSEETNDSLVIESVSLTDSGGYAVDVNNEGGTTTSDTIDLRVIYPVKIAAGGSHSLILKNDSSLWVFGSNTHGQLGNGTYVSENVPVEIMKGISNIAAGSGHSLILKTDGSLWVCGNNFDGQLGNGTNDNINVPDSIMNDVANIVAGGSHSLILKNDGTLWVCGNNFNGQLGNRTNDNINIPDSIMNDVAAIAAGGNHSLILKTDGSLWTCGDNYFGQLGNETNDDENTPDSIMNGVTNIAAGGSHSLILKRNGFLWVCGYNYQGQLGNGTNIDKSNSVEIMSGVENIAAGSYHSLILKNDGSLLACGDNYFGQLGNETNNNINAPVEIMNGVANIAAGYYHSLILKNDGTLWASGWNNEGQLGDGTTENKNTPVRIIPKSTNP